MSEHDDFEKLSRRLAGIDFSADSRVRDSLRAKLLGGRRAAWVSPARAASLSLVLAAAALILAFPFASRLHRAGEVRIAAQIRLPAASPRTPQPPKARSYAFPRGELGLPVLPGVLAATAFSGETSPLSTRAVDRLIDIHKGRTVRGKDRSAVVWEIDGTAYGLETRRIRLDDIFETRRL